MNILSELTLLLRKQSLIISVFTLFAIYILYYVIWTLLYFLLWKDYDVALSTPPEELLSEQKLLIIILQVVIIGPALETLLFQKLPFHFFTFFGWFRKNQWVIILFSSIIFGSIHFYSISYIIYNFIMGIFFMYFYIVRQQKNGYLSVTVFHGLHNLFALLMDPLEKMIFTF